MTAELLREAATKMRQRAQAAAAPSHAWWKVCDLIKGLRAASFQTPDAALVDAEHIASWHPAVALAVADWLDVAADHWDNSEHVVNTIAYTDGPEDECDEECPACQREEAATEVARAYLGRSA